MPHAWLTQQIECTKPRSTPFVWSAVHAYAPASAAHALHLLANVSMELSSGAAGVTSSTDRRNIHTRV
jgi:hypothetical protein